VRGPHFFGADGFDKFIEVLFLRGSSTLVFESYCSFGTGCLAGNGGQSETYFNMSDGKGSTVRPLGFFQQKYQDDVSHSLSVIARSDTWGFFDPTQTNLIFSIGAAHGAQTASVILNGRFVPTSPDGVRGDWLFQDGQSLIRSDAVGVAVAPNSSAKIGAAGSCTSTMTSVMSCSSSPSHSCSANGIEVVP